MDVVLAIVIAFAAVWFISHVAAASIDSAVTTIAQLVGGWRSDAWPRGVQEDDPDRPWGRPVAPSRRPSIPELKPTLSRVKPEVRPR